jgi:hypothetical protein
VEVKLVGARDLAVEVEVNVELEARTVQVVWPEEKGLAN